MKIAAVVVINCWAWFLGYKIFAWLYSFFR